MMQSWVFVAAQTDTDASKSDFMLVYFMLYLRWHGQVSGSCHRCVVFRIVEWQSELMFSCGQWVDKKDAGLARVSTHIHLHKGVWGQTRRLNQMENELLASSSSSYKSSCWASDVHYFGFNWVRFPPLGTDNLIGHICSCKKITYFQTFSGPYSYVDIRIKRSLVFNSVKSRQSKSRHSFSPANVMHSSKYASEAAWIWICPASVHYRWWFGSRSQADCACCLVTPSFTYASVPLVYTRGLFLCTQEIAQVTLKYKYGHSKNNKKKNNPELWCDCSPNSWEEEEDASRSGCRIIRGPEQYITHLQIRFIRINDKEHHDHITLTCNQRFMHFYTRN